MTTLSVKVKSVIEILLNAGATTQKSPSSKLYPTSLSTIFVLVKLKRMSSAAL